MFAMKVGVKMAKIVDLATDASEQSKGTPTDVEEEWEVEKITNVRIADNAKRQDKGDMQSDLYCH